MKNSLAAFVVASVLMLAGCSTFQGALDWATQTQTTPQEANSIAAASALYKGVAPAADTFLKSDHCNKACAATIADYSAKISAALADGLDAQAAGNSAKVKIALDAFNAAFPNLFGFLKQNGVSP